MFPHPKKRPRTLVSTSDKRGSSRDLARKQGPVVLHREQPVCCGLKLTYAGAPQYEVSEMYLGLHILNPTAGGRLRGTAILHRSLQHLQHMPHTRFHLVVDTLMSIEEESNGCLVVVFACLQ